MTLAEEFAKRNANKPKPKWVYGDRVFARWGKVPVIGMVVRETYDDPKVVILHLDLPVKDNNELRYVIHVSAKTMTRLLVM